MLIIKIPDKEVFDEDADPQFSILKGQTLRLEHSLVSLSKWESKWGKAFLTKKGLSRRETIDYIRCMTITQNVREEIYLYLMTDNVISEVAAYIDHPMTATTFRKGDAQKTFSREVVTSELIYYWMVVFNIPFDPCQKWHLNRLLTLINVCNIKNKPPKKMSKAQLRRQNRALNMARRQELGTTG
jgi:hypothetical protein